MLSVPPEVSRPTALSASVSQLSEVNDDGYNHEPPVCVACEFDPRGAPTETNAVLVNQTYYLEQNAFIQARTGVASSHSTAQVCRRCFDMVPDGNYATTLGD